MKKAHLLMGALLMLPGFLGSLHADSATWNGSVNGSWDNTLNWSGTTTVITAPGIGDIATFDSAGGVIDLIDLGTYQIVDQIVVDATGGTSYTIGVAGLDTLNFSDNGNDPNFSLTGAADADQTINADILLGPDSADSDTNFDLDSVLQSLVINGDIDTSAGGTPGIKRLEFGDFNTADIGSVTLNGNLANTGAATRVELYVAGSDLTLTGNVDGTSNTMRTIILNEGIATVNGTGNFGMGSMEVRNGTLNVNVDTQQFDNGLFLGNNTQANNDATVTIGAANILALNSGLTYRDDNNTANLGLIQGGFVQITGANRTFIAENNTLIVETAPELTVTSTITNDGGDRDLVVRNTNGGTLYLAPTNADNDFGGTTVQEGTLLLGPGALDTGGDFLTIAARNNVAALSNTVATVDLLGTTHTITGLNLGANGTANIANSTVNGFMANLIDSVGGGLLNVNNINYLDGDNTNPDWLNGPAVISADLSIAQNRNIQVQDGAGEPDLTISGDLNASDPAADYATYGDGTLALSGTGGTTAPYDRMTMQTPLTILGSGAPFGTGRVFLQQRNNAVFSDFPVVLDINGQDVTLNENLVVGAGNTANVASVESISVIDSAGGGIINLGGNVNNNVGSVGFENKTAFISADLNLNGSNRTITANDGADDIDIDVSGTITDDNGGGRTVTKGGTGVLRLSAPDNLYNILSVNNGKVIVTNVGALGDNDIQVGANTNDGILEFDLAADASVLNANQIRIGDGNVAAGRTGAGSVLSNGAGAVTFPNPNFFNELRDAATEDRTLTLGGTNTGDNTIVGAIRDNGSGGSVVSVVKDGPGKWILQGTNTYTGGTNVLDGRLDIDGSLAGNLTVANGASIGGDGNIASTVTLGMTSLFFDGSTAEALTAQGPIDTSAGVTVFVTANGAGALTVLNYNNAVTNNIDVSHFTLDGSVVVSGRGAGTFMDTGSSITIDLGFADKTWLGTTSGDWNEGALGEDNWTLGGGDEKYYDGDLVTFDDTSGFDEFINLTEDVAPGAVTFNNDTYTYEIDNTANTITVDGGLTVSGDANVTIHSVIAGDTALTKGDGADGTADGGILLLTSANSYTGGTNLEEGIIQITDSSALGTGAVTLSDAGAGNNTDPVVDIDADGLVLANDFVFSNAGNGKRIRFALPGTGNTAEVTGDITLDEVGIYNSLLEVADGETLTVSGLISGPGSVRSQAGGTKILTNGANSFTGILNLAGGITEVASIANAGIPSHAGAGSMINLGINDNDATLSYTGSGDSINRQFQIGARTFGVGQNRSGGGEIANNGTGGLTFTFANFNVPESNAAAEIGPRTLTLGGSYTGMNTILGVIADNDATDAFVDETVSLEVNTAGMWSLFGSNTYTGDTSIVSGTLSVSMAYLADGSSISIDGSTSVLELLHGVGDTVDTLFIDGVQAAAGTWGSSSSAATNVDDVHFSGTGFLIVSTGGADDYDTWAAGFGLVGGPGDDDDNDGVTNSEEYAYGLDPTDPASVEAISTPLDQGTGDFTYTRRNTGLSGLSYSYFSSTDLQVFSLLTSPTDYTEVSDGGDPTETVTVTLSAGLLTNPKLFVQVEAQ